MNITVFGTGYIGLVTGACLASAGHNVCCVDIDQNKVALLLDGKVPIYEPGLSDIVKENIKEGRLVFTTNAKLGVAHAKVIFIAVGTPPKDDGTADLQYVVNVSQQIANHIEQHTIIVNKSTVPVGTADLVEKVIGKTLSERVREDVTFDVCSNPEFLKEGAAITDFQRPDRIIIGTKSEHVKQVMRELYAAFSRNHEKLIFMDPRSAELTKYAANAMLATKISFINEMANIAEQVGADIEYVRQGIGSDPRIGFHFIYAGCGYGGSCFPKDVKALSSIASQNGYQDHLLQAVDNVNEQQKKRMLHHVDRHFGQSILGKKIAIWGLSFKPETDDVREATSKVLIEGLLNRGAKVIAYDPHAASEFQRHYGDLLQIEYGINMMTVLEGADALLICTEWRQFRSPEFKKIKALMNQAVIFDGRNIYEPKHMAEIGFDYYGVGRGLSVKKPS